MLVRLHMQLQLDERRCKCGALLDPFGFHWSTCSRVGVLIARGSAAEVCAARICREAGSHVKESQFVHDLKLQVPVNGGRRIEVIANGLPLWGGKQVAVDTTIVSALTGKGRARGCEPGQALREARKDKHTTYADVLAAPRCHLVVMGFEVAGRWSDEAWDFLQRLAKYKAQSVPKLLRRSVELLFFQRWTGLMACAVQNAYAATLLGEPLGGASCVNGEAVHVADLDRT